jgi:hypothetical protein
MERGFRMIFEKWRALFIRPWTESRATFSAEQLEAVENVRRCRSHR